LGSFFNVDLYLDWIIDGTLIQHYEPESKRRSIRRRHLKNNGNCFLGCPRICFRWLINKKRNNQGHNENSRSFKSLEGESDE